MYSSQRVHTRMHLYYTQGTETATYTAGPSSMHHLLDHVSNKLTCDRRVTDREDRHSEESKVPSSESDKDRACSMIGWRPSKAKSQVLGEGRYRSGRRGDERARQVRRGASPQGCWAGHPHCDGWVPGEVFSALRVVF